MIYGVDSQIPLYYEEYDGSINDKTGFIKVLDHIKDLGYPSKNMTFLMDRGFPINKNLEAIEKLGLKYISCVDMNHAQIKEVIKSLGNISNRISTQIEDSSSNLFYATTSSVKGHPNRKYLFFYSSKRRDNDVYVFHKKLNKFIDKILGGEEPSKKEQTLLNLITIHHDINNKIKCVTKNEDKIDEYAKRFGYFGFITNIENLTTKDCIFKYKLRMGVEIEFDEFKNDLGEGRKRTHNSDTNTGKTFVAFLAMIVRSYIGSRLEYYNEGYKAYNTTMKAKYSSLSNETPKDLLNDLALIEITNIYGNNQLFHPISKKQKTLLYSIGVSEDEILRDVEKER